MNQRFLLAIVAVLLAMVTIQSGASFAKQLFPVVGPEGTSALRAFFAALILTVIFRPWRARLSAKGWRNVFFPFVPPLLRFVKAVKPDGSSCL